MFLATVLKDFGVLPMCSELMGLPSGWTTGHLWFQHRTAYSRYWSLIASRIFDLPSMRFDLLRVGCLDPTLASVFRTVLNHQEPDRLSYIPEITKTYFDNEAL